MASKKLMEREETIKRYDAAVALRALADQLIRGQMDLAEKVAVPGEVGLEMSVKQKDKFHKGKGVKTKIEVEIQWTEGACCGCEKTE